MKTRIISGLVMLPLLILFVLGGIVLKVACLIIGILALREFYNAFNEIDAYPSLILGIIATGVLYFFSFMTLPNEAYMLWIVLSVAACLIYLFKMDDRKPIDAMVTLLGLIYVVFFSFHIALISDLEDHGVFIWMVLITAFITDIMAYFTGYYFGKRKLCPNISPKKTIEGAVGGTLGAVIVSGLFGLIFTEGLFFHCLLMGLLASIASQLGDLTASVIKRNLGLKDYSNLIPGHGGIMDRVDSVLFTAPVIYYYLTLVIL